MERFVVGREVPEHMRIEDAEAWFRNNALLDGNVEQPPTLDQQEDADRFERFRVYQQTVMGQMLADVDDTAPNDTWEQERKKERRRLLEQLRNDRTILFETKDGPSPEYPLYPFAKSCDTVFALATSWASSSFMEQDDDDDDDKARKVRCQLSDYSLTSTSKFALLVMGELHVSELDPDAVVDCCYISDYLQNETIRNDTEALLKKSIDTSNCLSICHLADRLGMPVLFESALKHLMHTLGSIVDEGSDVWEEMTPDLQERVLMIKTAIQSSVNSSQRSKLYFSNVDEYMAIFAEKVQYYRERLAEAKEQLAQLEPNTHPWHDTHAKICKQEQRVRTLSTALLEQKRLFGSHHRHYHRGGGGAGAGAGVVPAHLTQPQQPQREIC